MIKEHKLNLQIKGVKDGLLVSLGEGDWLEVQYALLELVQERSIFFQGAKMAVDVGDRCLLAVDLSNLRDQLLEKGIGLWAVLSRSSETEQAAQLLSLATRLSRSTTDHETSSRLTTDGEPALYIHRTLRSGHKIEYQGHIIIVGDVNPGAEVIASGSVVVWGRLRGLVHAGAEGNEGAMVCALDLTPTQLRIATIVSIPPRRKGNPLPEIAQVVDGQIIANPWNFRDGGL